jgi:hypothetical protein
MKRLRSPFGGWPGQSRRPASRTLSRRGHRRLTLERLEDRAVPAAFDVFGNTAFYQATPGAVNQLSVYQVGGALVLSDAREVIFLGPTARAIGCLGNGSHTILCPAFGLAGLILNTTDGNDGVAVLPRGLSVPVTVRNSAGSTDLSVDDSGDTQPQLAALTGTSVAGLGSAGITFAANELHSLTVKGGSGGNSFLVLDTPAVPANAPGTMLLAGRGADTVFVTGTSGPLTIDGGGAADTVVLGYNPVAGRYATLAGLRGALGVLDSGGTVNLFVEDPTDTAARAVVLDSAHVSGLSPALISFQNLSGLTVDGGGGGNAFTVQDTSAPTTLLSGAGNDLVNVQTTTQMLIVNGNGGRDRVTLGSHAPAPGGTVAGLKGAVSIDNTSGLTDLVVDSGGTAFNPTVAVTAGAITGLAPTAITFAPGRLASLTVNGGVVALTAGPTPGTYSASVPGTFTAAHDVNVEAIDVPTAGYFGVRLAPRNGSSAAGHATLYKSDGFLGPDGGGPGGGLVADTADFPLTAPQVLYTYLLPGRYYLAASPAGTATGDYTLTTDFQTNPANPFGSGRLGRFIAPQGVGSSLATAFPVTMTPGVFTALIGAIQAGGVNLFAVQLPAGARFIADLVAAVKQFPNPYLANGLIRVFDSRGNQVASSPPNQFSSGTQFTVPATGTYYVGVSGSDNPAYQPAAAGSGSGAMDGNYELNLRLSTGPDVLVVSLQAALGEATWGGSLKVTTEIQNGGQFDSGPFQLEFRLSTTPHIDDSSYPVQTIPVPAGAQARRVLLDSIDLTLPGSPFSPPPGFAGAQSVYLGVRIVHAYPGFEDNLGNDGNQGIGIDVVPVQILMPFGEAEPDDRPQQATPISPNAGVAALLGSSSDVDYYAVTIPARQSGQLRVQVSAAAGSPLDPRVSLYGPGPGYTLLVTADDTAPHEQLLLTDAALGSARESGLLTAHVGALDPNSPQTGFQSATPQTYYLAVSASHSGQSAPGSGGYYLFVQFFPESGAQVGNHPLGLATADFNNDHIPDLAVTNSSDSTVSILLGAGDGTFRQAASYTVGNGPLAVVAADFNGDKITDLAVADTYSGDVAVFKGFGDGTFALANRFVAGVRPSAMTAADFNHDGHTDLAINDVYLGWVTIFDGTGNFGFFPPGMGQIVQLNGALGTLVTGDFNGDGVPDLATADTDHDRVAVLLGQPDGTLGAPQFVPVGRSPSAITVGDFNADGISDLATTNLEPSAPHGSVSVLLGHSDGTFTALPALPVDVGPIGITAGDLNGDGVTDLVTTNASSGNLSLLLGGKGANGKANGTFAAQRRLPVGFTPVRTVIGDFNNDGRTDLATTDYQNNSVPVLLGQGDGTFLDNVTGVGNQPRAVLVADFNGDGVPDVVTANKGSQDLSFLAGTGTLAFQPEQRVALPPGCQPVALATGDFNHDGRADLAVATQGVAAVTILFGVGDGTFRDGGAYAAGLAPLAIVAADLNGDGFDDLAVADFATDTVTVLLGNKAGTFTALGTFSVGGHGPASLALGDFTGDHVLDLAVADFTSNEVTVLPGIGDGSFGQPRHLALGAKQPVALVAGDFNGDGRPDLATADLGSGDVAVLDSDGHGGFLGATLYPLGPDPTALAAADLDGDGRLDLAVSVAGSFTLATLLGDPSRPGAFLAPQVTVNAGQLVGLAPVQLTGLPQPAVVGINGEFDFAALFVTTETPGDGTLRLAVNSEKPFRATPLLADVNGDGVPDSVIVSRSGTVLFRAGRLVPGQPLDYDAAVPVNVGHPAQAVAVVRRRGAGPLLAAIDSDGNSVSLYELTADGWQRLPQTLATGLTPSAIAAADLNGDGRDDLVVGSLQSSTVQVFLADPSGAYRPHGDPIRTGFDTNDVLLTDVNGDKAPDILALNGDSNDVAVLLNDGTGSFSDPLRYKAGTGPYFSTFRVVAFFGTTGLGSTDACTQMAAADFDGDSYPDLAVIESDWHTVSVLRGKGSGGFGNPAIYKLDGRPLALAVSPLSPGGPECLVVLERMIDGSYDLAVFLGDGHGNLTRVAALPGQADLLGSVNLPSGLAFSDVDGDGRPDLLVGDEFGDVLTLLGHGDGTFHPFEPVTAQVSLAAPNPNTVVVSNAGADRVSVRNAVGGLLFTQDQAAGIKTPGAVGVADVGGGVQALVVANSGANSVRVYLGRGGLFDPATRRDYPAGDDPVGITIADLNGDGVPDVLVANRGSNDVSILIGQGRGSDWTLALGPRLQANGRGPVSVTVGDVTGLNPDGTPTGIPDHIPDLVISNSLSNSLSVLPGVGGGFFKDQSPVQLNTGVSPRQALLGDFTGDGRLDLVSVNAGSNDLTFFSDPNFGSAGNAGHSIASGGTSPLAAVAFAADGRENLIVANGGDGTLALFTGDANGLALIRTLADRLHPTDLALADLTSDQVSLFVANQGRDSAERVTFALDFGLPLPSFGEPGAVRGAGPVALLLPSEESTLAIIATLVPADLGPAPAAGGPEAATDRVLPAPDFLISLEGMDRGGDRTGGPHLGPVVEQLMAAIARAFRAGGPGGALPGEIRLAADVGVRTALSAALVPEALATLLGTAERLVPDLPLQSVLDDVGDALMRTGRSLLNLPEKLRRQTPRRRVPVPESPEEAAELLVPEEGFVAWAQGLAGLVVVVLMTGGANPLEPDSADDGGRLTPRPTDA